MCISLLFILGEGVFAMGSQMDLENISIQHWQFEDVTEVIMINRKCLPENYSRGTFLGLWNEFPQLLFLAFDQENSKVVGYIINKLDEGLSFFGKNETVLKAHIFSVAVLPKYRRRGIASALLGTSLNAAKAKDAKEVFLEVRKSNIPAINLYKEFNMEVIAEIPQYYADGEAANLMASKMVHSTDKISKIVETVRNKEKEP